MKKLILPMAMTLLLAACSKVTLENYEQVSVGMDKEEVEAILGGADECDEATLGTYSCRWMSGDKLITVKYAGDKVAFYSKEGF